MRVFAPFPFRRTWRALGKNGKAKTEFESLSYSHKKENVEWIENAKKPETRTRRVARSLEMLVRNLTPKRMQGAGRRDFSLSDGEFHTLPAYRRKSGSGDSTQLLVLMDSLPNSRLTSLCFAGLHWHG